jgi:hypothetical protein
VCSGKAIDDSKKNWLLRAIGNNKGASKNCFCYENVRNFLGFAGRSNSPQA